MPKLNIIKVLYHISGFMNVENHAYWQKLFRYKHRLQETPGTISRSGELGGGGAQGSCKEKSLGQEGGGEDAGGEEGLLACLFEGEGED